MKRFIWDGTCSVGVESIDEQHRYFFEIANKILDLAEKETIAREDVLILLGELGDYAFYHLGTEEKYFGEFGYEDAPAHIAAHNEYRKTVEHYLEETKGEKADAKKLAVEMASYSGEWLMRHIMVMDKKYTAVFHSHGLK
ncbi:MAG: bacteriohemerythrin [Patescibacteria group bacterium]